MTTNLAVDRPNIAAVESAISLYVELEQDHDLEADDLVTQALYFLRDMSKWAELVNLPELSFQLDMLITHYNGENNEEDCEE